MAFVSSDTRMLMSAAHPVQAPSSAAWRSSSRLGSAARELSCLGQGTSLPRASVPHLPNGGDRGTTSRAPLRGSNGGNGRRWL